MAAGETYEEFVEKFKPKLTTDDCYTPPNVYEAVKNWAVNEYGLHGRRVLRPFYPGGDFEREEYLDGDVVIDNPPFSILSKICRFYNAKGIDYFLFAPHLTLFSIAAGSCKYVGVGVGITYENGAIVDTSFVTSLGTHKIRTSPDLYKIVKAADEENLRSTKKELQKYAYPKEVITSSMLSYMSKLGQLLEIDEDEVFHTAALDAQRTAKKTIYGSGFLLSRGATARHAAAEKAAAVVWELSEREMEIIDGLRNR